jgi:hypothetical protein
MKWALIAAAGVIAVNAIVLVEVARERAAPASQTTIDICGADLVGGGTSDEPPALLLRIATDTFPLPSGLEASGLRSLGFSGDAIAAVGRPPDSTFRWPPQRPAWIRLRQQGGSLERFEVVAVAALRADRVQDSTSLVVRGRVGLSVRYRKSRGGPATPVPGQGVLTPVVVEIIPAALHLSRSQNAALRRSTQAGGCGTIGRAVIASGANGGIWVESVK